MLSTKKSKKTNMLLEIPTVELELVSGYDINSSEIELCGDCHKDFKKFMKKEV
jgi:hypothetical protein